MGSDRDVRDVPGAEAIEGFYAALLDDDAEALYQRAPCGYLSTTPDGLIVKVNQTFLALTGYRADELVGRRTFAQLLTGGGRIYHETHYAPMLEMQGTVREIALDIVRADGGRLPALVNSVLERDGEGHPRVVRTAVFDATERRGYERELVAAMRRAEASEARARSLAQTLQQTLIPRAAPDVPGLDVAAVYRPAGNGEEVGGDFYDIFEIAEGDWVVAVGDVCGKGVEAAVVTALARHTIRAAAVHHDRPSEILDTLNEVLRRDDTDRFCTVVLLRVRKDAGRWHVTSASGGHPLPLLSRAGGPPVAVGRPGPLVGVLGTVDFPDTDLVLERGDALVLHTDGVTEGRRGADFFGDDRLEAAVTAHATSASSLVHGVLDEVLRFQADVTRDDVVVVAIRLP